MTLTNEHSMDTCRRKWTTCHVTAVTLTSKCSTAQWLAVMTLQEAWDEEKHQGIRWGGDRFGQGLAMMYDVKLSFWLPTSSNGV